MPVICTNEPGGTDGAQAIKKLLCYPHNHDFKNQYSDVQGWSAASMTLLFTAARCDHIEKCIIPALEQGKIVLCDRYIDSTLVYQAHESYSEKHTLEGSPSMTIENIWHLHEKFAGLLPDCTIVLDIDPEQALLRCKHRPDPENLMQFESVPLESITRRRTSYLKIAQKYSHRCAVVSSDISIDDTENQIIEILKRRFKEMQALT
jgi:dTMP kinase